MRFTVHTGEEIADRQIQTHKLLSAGMGFIEIIVDVVPEVYRLYVVTKLTTRFAKYVEI